MGINLGYIFSKDIDETENEIRAITYMLNGDKQQLKLINSNLEGFKEYDNNLEARRDELKEQIKTMEDILKDKYGKEDWCLPSIADRAIHSKYPIFKKLIINHIETCQILNIIVCYLVNIMWIVKSVNQLIKSITLSIIPNLSLQ